MFYCIANCWLFLYGMLRYFSMLHYTWKLQWSEKNDKQMPFLTVNGSLIILAVVQLYHGMNQLCKLKTVKFTMN